MSVYIKIAGAVGAVILLVIILTVVSLAIPQGSSEVSFSYGGVTNSANTNLVSIVIDNPTSSGIVYYVGDLEWKSNGVWEAFSYPMGIRVRPLLAGRSITNVVVASPGVGEARVPILWGFAYSARATKAGSMWEDAKAMLRMHNSRGAGALYTNYVTGIKM